MFNFETASTKSTLQISETLGDKAKKPFQYIFYTKSIYQSQTFYLLQIY